MTRVKKFIARTDPSLVSQAYTLSRDIQISLGSVAQAQHDQLIHKVKAMIEGRISNPQEKMWYISYAQRIAKMARKYGKDLAEKVAGGEAYTWLMRGLDPDIMTDIADAMGLNIRPYLAPGGAPLVELRDRLYALEHTVREPQLQLIGDLRIPSGWTLWVTYGPLIIPKPYKLAIEGTLMVGGW